MSDHGGDREHRRAGMPQGCGWGVTPRPVPPELDVDFTRAVYPPHTLDVTYTEGSDESGWASVNRGGDKPWMHAQEQISGILRDDNGHLLEWHQVEPARCRAARWRVHG